MEDPCQGQHDLVEIWRTDESGCESVVRWCEECGAVVVDKDYDGRTKAGGFMRMQFPRILKSD